MWTLRQRALSLGDFPHMWTNSLEQLPSGFPAQPSPSKRQFWRRSLCLPGSAAVPCFGFVHFHLPGGRSFCFFSRSSHLRRGMHFTISALDISSATRNFSATTCRPRCIPCESCWLC